MEPFWNEVLIPNLQIIHGGTPVHSLQEIQFLKDTFPDHIKQYNIYEGDKILGEQPCSTPEKHLWHNIFLQPLMENLRMHFLRYLLILFKKKSSEFDYFSFGHSNEDNGRVLNQTLSYWKESFEWERPDP